MSKKRAIIIFNLGGPNDEAAIQPFLFNLFNDRAIINLPNPLRWLIARQISSKRTPVAKEIYGHIGGGSPILAETQKQADSLRESLDEHSDGWVHQIFISMRYWHPMADEAAANVKNFEPDEIVLLPLYPQFSITTTATGFDAWDVSAKKIGLDVPTRRICCYPDEPGWVAAQASLISATIEQAEKSEQPLRLLFSAHGLPERTVARGDPYPDQIEMGVRAIVEALSSDEADWCICYQSRVGPLQWIGPSLDEELDKAVRDGVGVIIVPLAFVSEHSETLVELDMDYRDIAINKGIKAYHRVPVVGTHPLFIGGLCDLVLKDRGELSSYQQKRICPEGCSACPMETGI